MAFVAKGLRLYVYCVSQNNKQVCSKRAGCGLVLCIKALFPSYSRTAYALNKQNYQFDFPRLHEINGRWSMEKIHTAMSMCAGVACVSVCIHTLCTLGGPVVQDA